MKEGNKKSELTRREFIKKTTAGTLGFSLLSGLPSLSNERIFAAGLTSKSKVVLVKHAKVISPAGEVDSSILKEMLDSAIINFSSEKETASYWKKIFSPSDIIGLKVNTLGLSNISGSPATNHFQAITSAIINSIREAGIKEENFIIWDRSEDELKSAGYAIQKEKGKTRILGNIDSRSGNGGEGYAEKEFAVGEKTTRLSKILNEMSTAMINIPLMKDHGTAGITGALKNHYGTINNARDFHSNNATNPGIPEVNMLTEIRNKQKIIIVDALMGVYSGGPRWDRRSMWPFGGILIGTDPVAIDTVLLTLINEKRISEGMPAITESHAKHIKISGELGLGQSNLEEINLVKIELA